MTRRRPDWSELSRLLDARGALHRRAPPEIARAAALYRSAAADLMSARAAGFSPELVHGLDRLVARAHAALYAAPPYRLGAVTALIRRDFPVTLRRHTRALVASALLFVLPAAAGFATALRERALALQVLPAEMVAAAEHMYAHGFDEGRALGERAGMTGFYLWNNVGIAFRCFATGILFGLGSMFFLVYNGLVTGAFAGLVTGAGHGLHLLTFVCGHAALELTAIVISGAAGLAMGQALVETGGLTRWGSLRARTPTIVRLVLGAALMLAAAALVEGFWSPAALPRELKWGVAALLWLGVALYLGLAGRGAATAPSRQSPTPVGEAPR